MIFEIIFVPTIIIIYNIWIYWYFQKREIDLLFHFIMTIFPIIYLLFDIYKKEIQQNIFFQIFGYIVSFVVISLNILKIFL
jgi:hypothetical protein